MQDLKSRKQLLGHFGGDPCGHGKLTPYIGLAAALVTLLDCEFITVSHALRLTPSAADASKGKQQELSQPCKRASHDVRLDLTVHLTEAALECTSNKGGKELCVLFHYLLTSGSGCKIGPDCDGFLNLGHAPVRLQEGVYAIALPVVRLCRARESLSRLLQGCRAGEHEIIHALLCFVLVCLLDSLRCACRLSCMISWLCIFGRRLCLLYVNSPCQNSKTC